MALASRQIQSSGNPPSNNLWIGNVSADVSDSELKAVFESYGKIESVAAYSSRNYGFVQFREIDSAKSAKQSLQGHVLRGNPLKIEFAKPAKPCKSLWLAGISQSVSKEYLEKEFLKFGKIQEFRFNRERNNAFVDYERLEDATQALNSMNGKRIGSDQIRVDFLRSQSSRRDQGPDSKEGQAFSRNTGPSDFCWMGQDSPNHQLEHSLAGSQRQHQFFSAQPTRVLWISHPPSVIIEKDMLHNAMILFGEIETIKTFPERNHAFIEFRSVEEARRAKEGLQGKLFNNPRILIEYSSSDVPGVRGHVEFPIQPVQGDVLGLIHPVLPANNPLRPPSLAIHGHDLYMRPPLGPSTFELTPQGPEFSVIAGGHIFQKPGPQALVGVPDWRSSPVPGLRSCASAGFDVTNRSLPEARDANDSIHFQRESKRSRIDVATPVGRTNEFNEIHGLHSLSRRLASGSSPRVATGGQGQRHTKSDCIWRGLIAKSGTPVCHARCIPIGEGLGADIPDVVNCSARTGLDLLGKHYDDAIGFNIVFFLPDSEEDFASYTEFLRYLGTRNRAGVAKFDDGTTLFLVPPSDFLTKVLKVSGPERLYGVVLNFPEVISSSTSIYPQSVHQLTDPNKTTSLHPGYGTMHRDERFLPLDSSKVLPEHSKLPPEILGPLTSSIPAQSVQPTAVTSQAGLALTPELIATLTSLLPANNGSSGSQSLSQTPSMLNRTSNVAAGPEITIPQWNYEHQALDHSGQLVHQLRNQINSQQQHVPQTQAPAAVPNMSSHFYHPVNSYSQMHEQTTTLPPQGAFPSRPMDSTTPLQSGPVTLVPEINHQYQYVRSNDTFRGQGVDHGTDALRYYNSSVAEQPSYPITVSSQVHGHVVSEPQSYTSLPSEPQYTHQSEQPETAPYGVASGSSEAEADKNERYKSTLLFAANLLSRIHQPQGNQPGQD